MINKIKNFTNTEEKKRLFSNFFSLSFLQGANYILPFITLPYLVRVLGVEYFGLLAFATTMIAYFSIIVDYGFNLTATREISINRDNKEKVIEIFSSILTLKFILMIVSFALLFIIVFGFQKLSKDWLIYFLTFGTVVGQVLFPAWFFHGMERMKYITYLNILAKVIFTVAVFIFVKTHNDYYIVPILTSLGMVIAGILSLVIIKKEFNVYFKLQDINTLKYHLKEANYIFVSNISASMYTLTTTVFLGIFTNNIIVGYYAIADKLIGAIKNLIVPLSQTLYPYISNVAMKSKDEVIRIIKKLSLYLITTSFFLTLFLVIYADDILFIIFGDKSIHSIVIFRILAIIPFLVVVDTLFGTLIMLVFKRNKEYSKIITIAGMLNLILALLLIPLYQGVGAAISVLIVELFITCKIIYYIESNGFNIIIKRESYEK